MLTARPLRLKQLAFILASEVIALEAVALPALAHGSSKVQSEVAASDKGFSITNFETHRLASEATKALRRHDDYTTTGAPQTIASMPTNSERKLMRQDTTQPPRGGILRQDTTQAPASLSEKSSKEKWMRKELPPIKGLVGATFNSDGSVVIPQRVMRKEDPPIRNTKARKWLQRDPPPITSTYPPHTALKRKWMRQDPPPMARAAFKSDGSMEIQKDKRYTGQYMRQEPQDKFFHIASALEKEAVTTTAQPLPSKRMTRREAKRKGDVTDQNIAHRETVAEKRQEAKREGHVSENNLATNLAQPLPPKKMTRREKRSAK